MNGKGARESGAPFLLMGEVLNMTVPSDCAVCNYWREQGRADALANKPRRFPEETSLSFWTGKEMQHSSVSQYLAGYKSVEEGK